jgi:ABC-type branched-subunit amino acid transport system permease subunit
MSKKVFLLGTISGLLAGIAGVIYARVYYQINEADFSKVASTAKIMAGSLFGGVLAAVGYTLLTRWLKNKGEIVFNLLFTLISYATLLAPIAARLPRNIDNPELFPGMVIPMHFFPALAWFTLKPMFIKSRL